MLLIELNEFNYALVRRIASTRKLKTLSHLLEWDRSATTTEDRSDSEFLEPWAQWVSVHTGAQCTDHGIKHLGDVPDLARTQLWERLDQLKVTTGVWGVMNGSRRDATQCAFFLPDPWTFTEAAYPASIQPLLDLPRYLARNYLQLSNLHIAKLFGGFLGAVIGSVGWRQFLQSLWVLRDGIIEFGARHLVFIAWFEYVSTLAFLHFYRRHRPDFALLFINTIAHAQHHYWRHPENGSREIAFALKVLDRILAKVLAAVPSTHAVIVTNALSQKNTNDEPAWILYRQKDPHAFVQAAGLNAESVEPLMTYDAHLVFRSAKDAGDAFVALSEATIEGTRAFLVEQNRLDPSRLFYRLDFAAKCKADAVLLINGRAMPFFQWFALVVQRTGRHIPSGVALSRGIRVPKKLQNHELFGVIVEHFAGDTQTAARPAATGS